ncbi:CDP-alcohol phosphatidyltransferase family protein [Candidatus Peregrinibacteria bacterium]|nr:CDP-alcohol phosphatidyltransferase family protein [Candidatus Peregrinibacteria bacterium]
MNIPNSLTLSRLFLTPVVALLLFINIPFNYYIAAVLYLIGCITDLLDGYFARKYKQETNLGIYIDPMVDKIFAYTLVMILLYLNIFPLWVIILIFVRDMGVDAFLNYAIAKKIYIKATYPGKYKSVFLNLAVIIGILALSASNGNQVFGLTFSDLYNAAYFVLIISFLVGFIGSNTIMQNSYRQIITDFKN